MKPKTHRDTTLRVANWRDGANTIFGRGWKGGWNITRRPRLKKSRGSVRYPAMNLVTMARTESPLSVEHPHGSN